MALNRSDKSRILCRYFPGMTRSSEMSTEPSLSGHLSTAQAGGSQLTIVRMGLLEETLLSGGARWQDLRSAGLFTAATEEGVEGLGHDARGARAAVSDGVVGMIAGSALCVRHGRSPRGKSEDLTIPSPSFSPQGLTVSNSTRNAGSHKAHYG